MPGAVAAQVVEAELGRKQNDRSSIYRLYVDTFRLNIFLYNINIYYIILYLNIMFKKLNC